MNSETKNHEPCDPPESHRSSGKAYREPGAREKGRERGLVFRGLRVEGPLGIRGLGIRGLGV